MEFAFSALLLLILILPGFILQFTFIKGDWRWNSPSINRPLTEQIPTGIITAALLHLIWASIASCIYPISLRALIMLVVGNYGHDEEHLDYILSSTTEHPYLIAFYFLSLYSAAAFIGYISHQYIRNNKIDLKKRFFRFNNDWFYMLRGEYSEFEDNADAEGKFDGILLTAIVHHGEKDFLYRGYVYDFFFDKDGNLDRVILTNADRRELTRDKTEDDTESRYYVIEGDYFILRYSEMVTMNFYYILISESSSESADIEVK